MLFILQVYKMTKLYNKKSNPYEDIPISIADQYTKEDNPQYFCSYCQRDLVLINAEDGEYYCKNCSISAYPEHEDVRSKSKITTPLGLNLEPCLSYLPDANPIPKSVEPEGTFKALQDKGIKITHYEERAGDGKHLKRNRWS